MTMIFDTPDNVTAKLPQLKALGIKTVIRYLTTSTASDKCIKPAEARAIAAAALRLGLVFEVWGGSGNFAHNDINAVMGTAHGEFSRQWAPNIGAPSSATLYFTVDNDAGDQQIRSLIIPYFSAAKAALKGQLRIGAYGCGAMLDALLQRGLIDLAWLANAMGWNGSRAFRDGRRYSILQRLPSRIAGLDVDPDDTMPMTNGSLPDIGDFVPFGNADAVVPAVPAAVVEDARWLQTKLNTLGAAPELKVDGDIGPASIHEIAKYLPAKA